MVGDPPAAQPAPPKTLENLRDPLTEPDYKHIDDILPSPACDPEIKTQKPFFECEKDLNADSTEAFVKAQTDPNSATMKFVLPLVGRGPHKGMIFEKENDLILMKRSEKDVGRIVVPECLRKSILQFHHNIQLAGHQGHKRMIEQIKTCFFWPGMRQDIKRWVKSCLACRRRKTPRPLRAGIREPRLATRPNETLAIDLVGPMIQSLEGNIWILTMIDQFSKWPVAVAIPDKSSAVIAEAIFRFWICEKGVPFRIVSDQGKELISKGMQQLCLKLGMKKVQTGGYNPTGNSTIERFHRYFMASLCILFQKEVPDWDRYIPPILFSYRASVNDTTGFSPFFLETGRDPNLPLHTFFPFLRRNFVDEESYVTKITTRLEHGFALAKERQYEISQKNLERGPEQYEPDFRPGDWLLVWERSAAEARLQADDSEHDGVTLPTKLRNMWRGPYEMIRWDGPRKCVINREGSEISFNVNRLTKQYPWDDYHLDSSGMTQAQPKKHKTTIQSDSKSDTPKAISVGDVVVFPMATSSDHKSPFGVGKILELRENSKFKFQWLGNRLYDPNGKFEPGWWDPKDNKSYYGRRVGSHPILDSDTTETEVSNEQVVAFGPDLLDSTTHISKRTRKIISESIIGVVPWSGGR
jgi:transposase InsO family protein